MMGTPANNYKDAMSRNHLVRVWASKRIEFDRATRKARDIRDASARPILETLQGQSYRSIGMALDAHGIKPPSGGKKWNPSSVYQLAERLGLTQKSRKINRRSRRLAA